MDAEFAVKFVEEWQGAWNSHDAERILVHYSDDGDSPESGRRDPGLPSVFVRLLGTAKATPTDGYPCIWHSSAAHSMPAAGRFRLV